MWPSRRRRRSVCARRPTILLREALHLHREAHRRVERADAPPLEAPARSGAPPRSLSPVAWNSRLATERAGLRIASRFIRRRKLSTPAPGRSARIASRWSASSGRSTETKPASSAPHSSATSRSHVASRPDVSSAARVTAFSRWRFTVGCSESWLISAPLLYMQRKAEKKITPVAVWQPRQRPRTPCRARERRRLRKSPALCVGFFARRSSPRGASTLLLGRISHAASSAHRLPAARRSTPARAIDPACD